MDWMALMLRTANAARTLENAIHELYTHLMLDWRVRS
jgi:hypothetical protein